MPSYDKPTCPQPTKHYLNQKKSRGVKDDGALVKLGDVDLAGKVPIRDLLGKVGEGTKKITEAVTDMLGDSLGGLVDNILKKVFSGESSLDKVKKLVTSLVSCGGLWNALEAFFSRIACAVGTTLKTVIVAVKCLIEDGKCPKKWERIIEAIKKRVPEFLGCIKNSLTALFEALFGGATELLGKIKHAIAGIWPDGCGCPHGGLAGLFGKIFALAGAVFGALQTVLGSLPGLVVGILQATGDLVKNIFEGKPFSSVGELVAYVLGDTLLVVKGVLNQTAGFLKALFGRGGGGIINNCNSGCGGIGGLIDRVLGQVLALTGQILEGVSKIGEAIEHLTGEPIGNLLEHIRSALGSGLETLRYAIKLLLRDLLPALLGGIVGFLGSIATKLGVGLEALKEALAAILIGDEDSPGLLPDVRKAVEAILAGSAELVNSILQKIEELLTKGLVGTGDAPGILPSLKAKVIGSADGSSGLRRVFALVHDVLGFAGKFLENINDTVTDVLKGDGIDTKLLSNTGELLKEIKDSVGDLLQDVYEALSPIGAKVKDLLDGVDSFIVLLLNNVLSLVGGIVWGVEWFLDNPWGGVGVMLDSTRALVGNLLPDDIQIIERLKETVKKEGSAAKEPEAFPIVALIKTILSAIVAFVQSIARGIKKILAQVAETLGWNISKVLDFLAKVLSCGKLQGGDLELFITALLDVAKDIAVAVLEAVRAFLSSLGFTTGDLVEGSAEAFVAKYNESTWRGVDGLKGLLLGLKTLLEGVLSFTKNLLTNSNDFVVEILRAAGDELIKLANVKVKVKELLGGVIGLVAQALSSTRDVVSALLGSVCGLVGHIIGDVLELVNNILLGAGLLVGGILLGVAGLLAGIYSGLKKCIGHIECGIPFVKDSAFLDVDIHPCTIPLVQLKLCAEWKTDTTPASE